MKKVIVFISIGFLFSKILFSQWAPNGATWHYNFSSFAVEGFYKISCIGDTLINNTNCKIMEKKMYWWSPLYGFDTLSFEHDYTYADQNKVYIFRYNTFYTLYDFSANIGDTIVIAGTNKYSSSGCDSIGAIRIDSIGTMNINGELLRYISVSPTPTSKLGWYARIVEKIGPIYKYQNNSNYTYLFPVKLDYCGMQLDELTEGGNLRCYSEPNGFIYNNLGIAPNCEYINTGIAEPDEYFMEFEILPNPTNGIFRLSYKLVKPQPIKLELFDNIGKIIISEIIEDENFISKEFNISNLKSGIYFIKIQLNNKSIFKKIIKH